MAFKFVASFALVAAAILGLVASAPQAYQSSPNYGHYAEDFAPALNEHNGAANAANEYAHAANAAHAANEFIQSGNNYNHPISNFAHSSEDFLRTTEGYAHVTEDYSRGTSGFVQASPTYGGSEYSTAAPSFSHLTPEFSTVAPAYSHPASQYSTPASAFSQSSPEYSTSTPAYPHSVHDYSGTHSPGYSHASSTYTHSTPTYTHSHPTYSPSTPTYTQAPPTYTHVTPSYSHAHQDYSNSVTKDGVQIIDADYNANPEYSYSYNVHDERTGDIKNHQETRRGDVVEGSYSLVEADGTRRIVEYTADAQNGFNAIVHKEGTPRVPIAEHYTTDPSVPNGYSPVTQAPSVFGGHADHGSNHINYATPSYGYQH